MVTLRIRQVIPRDGLSAGDRVLNGLPVLFAGDRVIAEVVAPGSHPPALVGGTVARIAPPRRFGKPGRVTLELGQLVTRSNGQSVLVPWAFDLEDRRFNVNMRRKILLALFAAEGAGVGASVGSELSGGNNPLFIGGGAGVGLLSGIGYASLMPGREATLDPGDTFQVTVGTLAYRPIAPSPPLELYPARGSRPWQGSSRPMSDRPVHRYSSNVLIATILIAGLGCGTSTPRQAEGDAAPGNLPPAYTRDKIIDPKLLEVARSYTAWVESQKTGSAQVFLRVEVIPPTPTLLPYGIGTYQKETRVPAILITGPGWLALKPDGREAIAAQAFQNLSDQLAAASPNPRLLPSITIQTPQGLELAWINQLEPGGTYLHGERE